MAESRYRETGTHSSSAFERAVLIAGRALFGGYFLYNGINHFRNRQMLTEYARGKGVPAADVAVPATGLMMLAGGLSIITGLQPKWGSALITAFLLGVSPQMHAFWKEQDPQARMPEMINFTKNMALVGAGLLAAAHPEPWAGRLPLQRGTALSRAAS